MVDKNSTCISKHFILSEAQLLGISLHQKLSLYSFSTIQIKGMATANESGLPNLQRKKERSFISINSIN